MTTQITMPQLGESIHEGVIGKWLKQPGDTVERFEPIVEILTDKVNAEIPSPVDGVLSRIIANEGETVEIGAIIGEMQEVGAMVAATVAPSTNGATKEKEATGVFPSGTSAGGWYVEEADELDLYITPAKDEEQPRHPNRYSPAVRRLAEEHHLNLDTLPIKGSGISGRVTRNDVLNYLEMQRNMPQVNTPVVTRATAVEAVSYQPSAVSTSTSPAHPMPESVEATPVELSTHHSALSTSNQSSALDTFTPLTPMRKTIAEHMTRSKQTAPHAWTIVEVDMTRLVRHRGQIKEAFKQREGLDLSYLPFVIKAVVEALKQFPQLNASWSSDGAGIIVKRELNIGVAIDVLDGLVVPVIQRADEKSLVGLARNLNDLISRARSKKLTLADLQGGTFTVNNPGAFGSVMSYPIINQPQAAIVTMESIVKRPVIISDDNGDTIAIRSMMNMCISFDHRVVDGAIAGRFLQAVKKWLETSSYE